MDLRKVAMAASLGTAALMLVGKLGAYYLTGSTAILSDAAESVIHIFATGVAAASLWYSSVPADKNHPYGHGKIAYFSAGFEGALILSAAVTIVFLAVRALITGPELQQLGLGLAITGALAGVNLVLGLFLVYVGKTRNAVILLANGKHVLTDMWTSVGVLGGVAIVWATGLFWLDPVVAILVGLNIFVSAIVLINRSFQGLLDTADPEETALLLACLQGAVDDNTLSGFHQLRHRRANDVMWIEVHMLLPDDMRNVVAHEHVTRVERRIQDLFGEYTVHVTSHIEPASHDAAHPEGHSTMESPLSGEAGVPGIRP